MTEQVVARLRGDRAGALPALVPGVHGVAAVRQPAHDVLRLVLVPDRVAGLDLDQHGGLELIDDFLAALEDVQFGALDVYLDEIQPVQFPGEHPVQGVHRHRIADVPCELRVGAEATASLADEGPAGHHAVAAHGHAHVGRPRLGSHGEGVVADVGERAHTQHAVPHRPGKRQRLDAVHHTGRSGQPRQRKGIKTCGGADVDADAAGPDQAGKAEHLRLEPPGVPRDRQHRGRRDPSLHSHVHGLPKLLTASRHACGAVAVPLDRVARAPQAHRRFLP